MAEIRKITIKIKEEKEIELTYQEALELNNELKITPSKCDGIKFEESTN